MTTQETSLAPPLVKKALVKKPRVVFEPQDLELYNKTVRLAASIELTTKDFPKSTAHFVDRLVRSAEAIQRFFAHAYTQGKGEDKKNYLWRVQGSIQECLGLIEVATRQGFVSPNLKDMFRLQLDDLHKRVQEIIRGATR